MVNLICTEQPRKRYPVFIERGAYEVTNPEALKMKSGVIRIKAENDKVTIQPFEFINKLLVLKNLGGKFRVTLS